MPIVEFEEADGGTLLVKVTDPGSDLVTRGLGGESGVVERAQRTFAAALQPIRTVSEAVLAELSAIPRKPDSMSVEFGLDFTANTKAVVVGVAAGATIRVQMSWTAPAPAVPAAAG